ncbi:MAG: 1-acyl-sn-glycerol-3-phosphate acyltransferase [Polyangia bacterium]
MQALSSSPMFRFDGLRSGIIEEVTERIVDAHARAERTVEPLDRLLNELVIHEQKRLRHVHPPDTIEDKRRVDDIARALQRRATEGELLELLRRQARAYAQDIAGSFSNPTYKVATSVLPSLLSLLLTPQHLRSGEFGLGALDARVRIDGDIEQLRRLSATGVLVVVPTHLSNLDSPLVGYALMRAGLPPMAYGAGKNLFSSPLTSFFMARLGAYKVDRRLGFPLYKEILKTFSQVILEEGLHSIFFPGGTRSRSGAVESKLKLGLAGTALSAYVEQLRTLGPGARRFYFVPMTLNTPLVLEAETLIEDYLKEIGKNRYIIEDDEFSRMGRVATYARKVMTMDQGLELRFCAPRDPFGNHVDADGRSLDSHGREIDPARYVMRDGVVTHHAGRDAEYTRELGRHIVDDFREGTSYFSTHIVSAALFAYLEAEIPGSDLYQRLRHPRRLVVDAAALARRVDAIKAAIIGAPALGRLAQRVADMDGQEIVDDALSAFSGYHTHPAAQRSGSVIELVDRELILYYRNRLAHHGPALEAARPVGGGT